MTESFDLREVVYQPDDRIEFPGIVGDIPAKLLAKHLNGVNVRNLGRVLAEYVESGRLTAETPWRFVVNGPVDVESDETRRRTEIELREIDAVRQRNKAWWIK